MIYYKAIKRRWRRFYKAHRESLDDLGCILGGLSVFATILSAYFILVAVGGM